MYPLYSQALITCEHGGNKVPRKYARLFAPHAQLLASHQGWDPGALRLAERLAADLGYPCESATTTRLLVDLNRSRHNRDLFSEITRPLDRPARQTLVAELYEPFRARCAARLRAMLAEARPVLHLSVHTFTPIFDGERREVDVGLLFDPRRSAERALCIRWRDLLREADPQLRIRFNYPYLGRADGHVTHWRKELAERDYLGVELEVSQTLATSRPKSAPLARLLAHALRQVTRAPAA